MVVSAADHLAVLEDRAAEVAQAVEGLVDGVDPQRLSRRPAPESWSAAHCLAHLAIANELYLPPLRRAVEGDKAIPAAPDGNVYRPGWFGRWFIRTAGPEGRNLRAVPWFRPDDEPPADAAARFLARHRELRGLLAAAQRVDLTRSRVKVPVIPLLTLGVGECLDMLIGHEERHLAQAERALAAGDDG